MFKIISGAHRAAVDESAASTSRPATPFKRSEVERLGAFAERIRETTHGLWCESASPSTPATECTSLACAWLAWDIARDVHDELQQCGATA
jgi:hypothetical protein